MVYKLTADPLAPLMLKLLGITLQNLTDQGDRQGANDIVKQIQALTEMNQDTLDQVSFIKQQVELNNYFVKRIYFINCFLGGIAAGEFTFNMINTFNL